MRMRCCPGERDHGKRVPQVLLLTLLGWDFVLAWGVRASPLVSGFLTNGIGPHIVESVCPRKEGGSWAFYYAILLTLSLW